MNDIKKAIELLKNNELVGIPTETVYGLAGAISSEESIKKIFSTKKRPFFDPLIVHVCSINMAKTLTKSWPDLAQKLAQNFWPGPLTIVLPKSDKVSDLITSGLESVGLRCPNHPIALELISQVEIPLAAPSANKFTKTSPTTKAHVVDEFGDDVFVLDGGQCHVGIESTVVGIDDNHIKIFRPGVITKEQIINVVSPEVKVEYTQSPVAPGQMKHHYMPKRPVVLTTQAPADMTFWEVPSNVQLACRQLYSKLRELDQKSKDKIFIVLKEEFKQQDSWRGFLNRLDKAKSEDYYF